MNDCTDVRLNGVLSLLLSSDILVLVHPSCVDRIVFLPCAYGYASTVRKLSSASTVRVR